MPKLSNVWRNNTILLIIIILIFNDSVYIHQKVFYIMKIYLKLACFKIVSFLKCPGLKQCQINERRFIEEQDTCYCTLALRVVYISTDPICLCSMYVNSTFVFYAVGFLCCDSFRPRSNLSFSLFIMNTPWSPILYTP